MTKVELVKVVADKTGFTQKDVKAVMEAVQEVVFATLKEDEIKLMDGITLSAVYKEATVKRNPQTGEPINVSARYAPKAKFGTALKNALNE